MKENPFNQKHIDWCVMIDNEIENLRIRLEELKFLEVKNPMDYFKTKDAITYAIKLLESATFSIYGLDISEILFENKEKDNEQQENTNIAETESK